jgi:hypothetical protein
LYVVPLERYTYLPLLPLHYPLESFLLHKTTCATRASSSLSQTGELTMTLSSASKKDRKHARESGGIAAAVTKQTAGKFA